jgi:uncharacterized coiled-coil protein SlyX
MADPQGSPDGTTRLEEQMAFLERHVEELDSVVRELYERLDSLRDEIGRLRDDTTRRFESMTSDPADDRPPHWGPPRDP